MKRFGSISVLLSAITVIMAAMIIAVFAISARNALDRLQLAERVRTSVDISRGLFDAMQDLRVERGTVNTALASPAIAGTETQVEIAALRARSGKALDAAMTKLAASALARTGSDCDQVQKGRAMLDVLRRKADAALRLPKSRRPAALGADWVAAENRLVDAIDNLSEVLSGEPCPQCLRETRAGWTDPLPLWRSSCRPGSRRRSGFRGRGPEEPRRIDPRAATRGGRCDRRSWLPAVARPGSRRRR